MKKIAVYSRLVYSIVNEQRLSHGTGIERFANTQNSFWGSYSIARHWKSLKTKTAKREERIVVVPDPTTADADDDFGFTTTITSYTDSKKYNPTTDTDV